jgi:hypothetical protein
LSGAAQKRQLLGALVLPLFIVFLLDWRRTRLLAGAI